MPDQIGTYFLTQGVLGVTVLVLAYVCIKLYSKTERLQARIEELYELRLQDSKQVNKDYSDIVEGNSHNMRLLTEKIEVSKGK